MEQEKTVRYKDMLKIKIQAEMINAEYREANAHKYLRFSRENKSSLLKFYYRTTDKVEMRRRLRYKAKHSLICK
jgi:hypothetical protein